MNEQAVPDPSLDPRPSSPAPDPHPVGDDRGHTATFHFADGTRLVIAVADAVAFSCGGGQGHTHLLLLSRNGHVRARGNLAGLLRKHPPS